MTSSEADRILAAKSNLLARATETLAAFNQFIAKVEADVNATAPEQERRLRRAERTLADVDRYLKILTAAYEDELAQEQENDDHPA